MTAPYNPYPHPGYGYAPAPPQPRNGFGITALCLALTGLVFGLVPFTGFIAVILGALAVLFGLLGLGRVRKGFATNRKMSIIGSVLGTCALALGIWGIVIVFQALDDLSNGLEGSPPSVQGQQGVDGTSALPPDGASGIQVAAFGETFAWEDGLQVAVGAPQPFRPSSTAAGADGARALSLEVTVTNGSDKPVALSSLVVQASFDGQMASPIYDSANGMNGTPSTSVLPGKTSTFTIAFPADVETAELQVELTPGFTSDRAYFVGQV